MAAFSELWLVAAITALGSLLLLILGFVSGYYYKDLYNRLYALLNRIHEIEEENKPESAIVETTPQLIRQKVRRGDIDDGESAVVTVKSPRQLRADKDRQLKEELDRLGT